MLKRMPVDPHDKHDAQNLSEHPIVTVRCDVCDWNTTTTLESMDTWVGQRCPQCQAVMVDKKDLMTMRAIFGVAKVYNAVMGFRARWLGKKVTYTKLRVQTDPERKRKGADE